MSSTRQTPSLQNKQTNNTNQNKEGNFQFRYTWIADALIPQRLAQLELFLQQSFIGK